MELMSSLLLCALLAFLPQAPGQSRRKFSSHDDEYNNSKFIRRGMGSIGANIILNKNAPLNSKVTDLQSIFMDPSCRGCAACMERAMKAHKPHTHMMDPRISSEYFQDDRNMIDISIRDKRKVEWSESNTKKPKRSKPKKNRVVSLKKYNNDGRVYALRVNEPLVLDVHNNNETVMTCQVYSVKKSVPCDSPEANLILTDSRKKTNRKSKKGHEKREAKTVKPIETVIASMYTKLNVDDSQVPEQIMPSIEEMY